MLATKIKWDQEPTLREKFFFIIVIVGILIFFYNTLWEPRAKKLREVSSQVDILTDQAAAIGKLIEATQLQIAKGKTEPGSKAEPEMDVRVKNILERRVVDPIEEVNNTAAMLQDGAIRMRLNVKKMDVGDKIEKGSYSVVPISAEIYGPYLSVINYLDKLESIDRPIVVKSFKMQSDKSTLGNLDLSMEVNLYFAKR